MCGKRFPLMLNRIVYNQAMFVVQLKDGNELRT